MTVNQIMNHPKAKPRHQVSPVDTLYLSNIPANANNIMSLVKHFKKYGHIKSIWSVGTIAAISFDSVESCKRAYESPEAFANNRFVRYFYHKKPENAECKLSLAVNLDKVKATSDSVLKQMASEAKNTIYLQAKMSLNTAQPSQSAEKPPADEKEELKQQLIEKSNEQI